MYNDITQIEDGTLDVLFMMDVLEHVSDDGAFLALSVGKLRPGGVLILTVPAFNGLFSAHDKFLRHFRRYSRSELYNVAHNCITVKKLHYFYSSLALARVLQKVIWTVKPPQTFGVGGWKHSSEDFVTRLVKTVLDTDFAINDTLANYNLILPGLSLLMVGVKTG